VLSKSELRDDALNISQYDIIVLRTLLAIDA